MVDDFVFFTTIVQFHLDITKVGQVLKKFPSRKSCAKLGRFCY